MQRPRPRLHCGLAAGLSTTLVTIAATFAVPAVTAQSPQFGDLRRFAFPFVDPPRLAASIAVGDVDRDGDLDVFVGAEPYVAPPGGQDRLFLNDGRGQFVDATATRLPVETGHGRACALADFDGDGDLDLYVGNSKVVVPTPAQDFLWLNDGTGRFADMTATHLPIDDDFTEALAAGDVDGDGDVDLLLGNQVAQKLYLNDGSARFTLAAANALPSYDAVPSRVRLGDVDRDGDLDVLMVFMGGGSTARLYRNDGSGRFTDVTATHFPGVGEPYDGAFVDLDRDGDLDVVTVTSGLQGDRYWRNDGTGAFTDATPAVLNGRKDDLLLVHDVDGDNDLDLVLTTPQYQAPVDILRNDGAGNLTLAPAGTVASSPFLELAPEVYAFVDADGDGDDDLVASGRSGLVRGAAMERLWRNDGSGRFRDESAPQLGGGARSVACGDADGDGDQDVLVLAVPPRLYRNDGANRFTDVSNVLPANTGWATAAVFADFDRDGDQDVMLAMESSGGGTQDLLWRNDGALRFTDVTATHMPRMTDRGASLAVGDVDRDGDLDAVIGNLPSGLLPGGNRLLLNDGTGRFVDATATHMPQGFDDGHLVDLGDADGDGFLDLIQGGSATGKLSRNDGTGRFVNIGNVGMPNDAAIGQAVGDLDHDGLVDVVLAVYGRGFSDFVCMNQAAGQFLVTTLPAHPGRCLEVELGDVDGDRHLDAVFVQENTSRWFQNDGAGNLAERGAAFRYDRPAQALAFGDLDGDGDLDLVLTPSPATTILWNHHRQYWAPDHADLGARFRFELHARPGYAVRGVFGLPLIADAEATPAIALPPLGVLGLDPLRLVAFPGVLVRNLPVFLDPSLPNDPSLRGATLATQVAWVDLDETPVVPRLGWWLVDRVR